MNPGDIMIVFSLRAEVTAVRVSVSGTSSSKKPARTSHPNAVKRHGDQ
jgi:hypothetical protein